MEDSYDEESSGAEDDNDDNRLWANYRESYGVDIAIVDDGGNCQESVALEGAGSGWGPEQHILARSLLNDYEYVQVRDFNYEVSRAPRDPTALVRSLLLDVALIEAECVFCRAIIPLSLNPLALEMTQLLALQPKYVYKPNPPWTCTG